MTMTYAHDAHCRTIHVAGSTPCPQHHTKEAIPPQRRRGVWNDLVPCELYRNGGPGRHRAPEPPDMGDDTAPGTSVGGWP